VLIVFFRTLLRWLGSLAPALVLLVLGVFGSPLLLLTSRASAEQARVQTQERLTKLVAKYKPKLPAIADESLTILDVRLDGTTVIMVGQVRDVSDIENVDSETEAAVEVLIKGTVCNSSLKEIFEDGGTLRYEYWSAPPNRRLVKNIDIKNCSATVN
jgi:hypothetical protein